MLTSALGAVVNIIGTALTTPFVAALTMVIYFDLRVRKEGFDLFLLASRVGVDAPSGGFPTQPGASTPLPGWPPPGAAPWGPPPAGPGNPPPGWSRAAERSTARVGPRRRAVHRCRSSLPAGTIPPIGVVVPAAGRSDRPVEGRGHAGHAGGPHHRRLSARGQTGERRGRHHQRRVRGPGRAGQDRPGCDRRPAACGSGRRPAGRPRHRLGRRHRRRPRRPARSTRRRGRG